MVAIRILSLLLVLGLGTTAEAREIAYEAAGGSGDNNASDQASGDCSETQGCFDQTGLPCTGNVGHAGGAGSEECIYQVVPAGRCARGSACVWPVGAGFCSSNNAVACLSDNGTVNGPSTQCSGLASDVCDMSTNNAACECSGTDADAADYEATVCGVGDINARCSDGDVLLGTGGEAGGLCVVLQVTGQALAVTNCGFESNAEGSYVGPKFGLENSADVVTAQRLPGMNPVGPHEGIVGHGGGPILDLRTTLVINIDPAYEGPYGPVGTQAQPGGGGVRLTQSFANSYFADFTFASGTNTGGTTDANIEVYYCDSQELWRVNHPVYGACSAGSGGDATFGCVNDVDCDSSAGQGDGVCDPGSYEYCYDVSSQGFLLNGYGAIWPRDLGTEEVSQEFGGRGDGTFNPNALDTCPPNCRSMVMLESGEQEALTAAQSQDAVGAAQLGFDNLVGPHGGKGLLVSTQPVVAQTWVSGVNGGPSALFGSNVACYIGGNPDVINSACGSGGPGLCADKVTPCSAGTCPGKTGRCADASGSSCDPTVGGLTECAAGASCLLCNVTPDSVGAASPCVDCTFSDSARGCTLAGPGACSTADPIGFDDHGFTEAFQGPKVQGTGAPGQLAGRVGGLGDLSASVRTPILALLSNTAQWSKFGDNTCTGIPAEDLCTLGQAQPGTALPGIGGGGVFPMGSTFAIFPAHVSGEAVTWDPFSPIVATGSNPPLNGYDWGPGPNGIPGCIGDNDPGQVQRCNEVLGGATSGSTGSDDVPLFADFSEAQDGSLFLPAVRARGSVSDPWAAAPVLINSSNIPIVDLTVLIPDSNTDVITKGWNMTCPLVGTCSGGGSCFHDDDCGGGTCENFTRDCTQGAYCSERGGDSDGDGYCDDDDPCDLAGGGADYVNTMGAIDSDQDGIFDDCQCGDATGDGKVNAIDIGKLALAANNVIPCNECWDGSLPCGAAGAACTTNQVCSDDSECTQAGSTGCGNQECSALWDTNNTGGQINAIDIGNAANKANNNLNPGVSLNCERRPSAQLP